MNNLHSIFKILSDADLLYYQKINCIYLYFWQTSFNCYTFIIKEINMADTPLPCIHSQSLWQSWKCWLKCRHIRKHLKFLFSFNKMLNIFSLLIDLLTIYGIYSCKIDIYYYIINNYIIKYLSFLCYIIVERKISKNNRKIRKDIEKEMKIIKPWCLILFWNGNSIRMLQNSRRFCQILKLFCDHM